MEKAVAVWILDEAKEIPRAAEYHHEIGWILFVFELIYLFYIVHTIVQMYIYSGFLRKKYKDLIYLHSHSTLQCYNSCL